jgi:hypothetical protein
LRRISVSDYVRTVIGVALPLEFSLEPLMIAPQRIMSLIAWAMQVYPPSSWTNTSPGHPSLSRRKSTKGSPPCFSNAAIGSRHFITTTEDDGTVATKTKKSLGFTKETKAFSIVGVKGFEPSTLWSQSNFYRTQKTCNSSVIC